MSRQKIEYERIYATIRSIPPGKVATYGQVASEAGYPGHARQVGYALSALKGGSDVPWQRVVNARGEISPRSRPGREPEQKRLLEKEGVHFTSLYRLALDEYQWDPDGAERLSTFVERPA